MTCRVVAGFAGICGVAITPSRGRIEGENVFTRTGERRGTPHNPANPASRGKPGVGRVDEHTGAAMNDVGIGVAP